MKKRQFIQITTFTNNAIQRSIKAQGIILAFILISGCVTPSVVANQIPEPPVEKNIGHSESRTAINLGTGIPLRFVEANSPLDSTPLFIGRSLGSAAISFTNSGVTFVLSKDDADNAPAAKIPIHFVDSYSIPNLHGIDRTKSVTHQFIGLNPKHWTTNLPNYAAVEYSRLYDGVTLRYEANGRILKSTYTLAAGIAAERIRWRVEDIGSVQQQDKIGTVRFSVNLGDKQRGLTLGKPTAMQGDRKIDITYQIDKGTFGFKITNYDPTKPLVIKSELMYSRHFDDYDARKAVDGTLCVVGGMVSPRLSENGDVIEDIFVARLDSNMYETISTTIIGGNGDDKAFGMALAWDGAIYVTGKTNSADYPVVNPVQKRLGGAYDAFLLKLSNDGQRLIASTYLGGAGRDAGEAININANSTICIAGKAGSKFPLIRPKQANYTTLFPTPTLADNQQEHFYFFGQIATNLDKIDIIDHFTAPSLPRPLIIWSDVHQRPVIGVSCLGSISGSCSIPKSYQMAHYQDPAFAADPYINYNMPPNFNCWETGWGYHALRWKALNAPTYAYNPGSATNVPLGYVSNGDELLLNTVESSSAFNPVDPPGYWQVNAHNSVEKLALGAAYYMSRWGSPVYANAITYNDIFYGTYTYNMAIEKVTYCVVDPNNVFSNTPAQQLHNLCNFNNISPGQLTVSCANQGQFSYKIDELGVSLWGLPLICHLQNQVRDATFPSWTNWYSQGVYIGDPPVEEAHLATLFQDAGDQLRDWFVTESILTGRVHRMGFASAPLRFKCYVRSAEIHD